MPIDLKRAESELLTNKNTAYGEYRDKVSTGEVICCNKSCESIPDGVCEECVQYVCKEHIHRHPNCDEGK